MFPHNKIPGIERLLSASSQLCTEPPKNMPPVEQILGLLKPKTPPPTKEKRNNEKGGRGGGKRGGGGKGAKGACTFSYTRKAWTLLSLLLFFFFVNSDSSI
jgi:hypothetical protein